MQWFGTVPRVRALFVVLAASALLPNEALEGLRHPAAATSGKGAARPMAACVGAFRRVGDYAGLGPRLALMAALLCSSCR